jgi:c(7)-type cytochrome triheme protein
MKFKMTEDQRPKTDNGQRTITSRPRSPFLRLRSFILVGTLLVMATLFTSVVFAVEGDIVFKREGREGGTPVAVFPHWFHRIRYKCYACHPGLFQMKAEKDKISMEAIQAGKFCGACHNGKVAWAVNFETCNRCHVGK